MRPPFPYRLPPLGSCPFLRVHFFLWRAICMDGACQEETCHDSSSCAIPQCPTGQAGARPELVPVYNERPQTLDAHRRLLFAQRLAILIQRRRAVTTVVPREDAANEYA